MSRKIRNVPIGAFDNLRKLLGDISPPDGRNVIMSIGDPQETCPDFVKEVIEKNGDKWGQYPPIEGISSLREAFASWTCRRFSVPEQYIESNFDFIPVNGTREALFMLASFLTPEHKNGEQPAIIIPSPCYPGYVGAANLSGAEPVFVSSSKASGHLPDLSEIDEKTWKRTVAFYLTTPGNPQGMAANREYFKQVFRLAEEFDFTVVSDECAIDLYTRSIPLGSLQVAKEEGFDPDRLVVVQSLSKRSYAAGIRSGCVMSGKLLMQEFRRVRGYGGATVPVPIQAASAALWGDDAHVQNIRDQIDKKISIAEQIFEGRHDIYRPDAGFFLWLKVDDDLSATRALWQQGIKVMPGRFLANNDLKHRNSGNGYIRVGLVHDCQILQELLPIMTETLQLNDRKSVPYLDFDKP